MNAVTRAMSCRSGAPTLPPTTLEQRAKIRGAMWTARLDLPWGPRPNQPDNNLVIDYFEVFSLKDQDRMLAAYGPKGDGYTHAPMGPMVDAGYHGQLPATDWRRNPNVYLDAAVKEERAGVQVIHFLRPDRGCVDLEWTVEDLERELGPIFRSAKAQAIMRIVCLGWEPGPRYYYDNAWWCEMTAWMARTFPNALRLIHMVSDCDAPAGRDDDKKGISNGKAWANLAGRIHGWLVQNAGYTDGDSPTPSAHFMSEFTKQFDGSRGSLITRFTTGGPMGDWPVDSAWGVGQRLRVYAGEFAAYADYWKNWPEEVSRDIGDSAIAAGADGSLDGCHVN